MLRMSLILGRRSVDPDLDPDIDPDGKRDQKDGALSQKKSQNA
jgi:hypothetical protein